MGVPAGVRQRSDRRKKLCRRGYLLNDAAASGFRCSVACLTRTPGTIIEREAQAYAQAPTPEQLTIADLEPANYSLAWAFISLTAVQMDTLTGLPSAAGACKARAGNSREVVLATALTPPCDPRQRGQGTQRVCGRKHGRADAVNVSHHSLGAAWHG